MEIIPSILALTEEQFKNNLVAIQGVASMIHIDICDGKFVPSITATTPELAKKYLTIDCELHLMVKNPINYLDEWSNVPQIKCVFVHIESGADIEKTIAEIHNSGWSAGIALNPETPAEILEPFLNKIEAVMFMGVYPGRQSGEFIPEELEKARKFKRENPHLRIEWDGAVNEKTIARIATIGIDAVCPGSAIFGNEKTPAENMRTLQSILKKMYF